MSSDGFYFPASEYRNIIHDSYKIHYTIQHPKSGLKILTSTYKDNELCTTVHLSQQFPAWTYTSHIYPSLYNPTIT